MNKYHLRKKRKIAYPFNNTRPSTVPPLLFSGSFWSRLSLNPHIFQAYVSDIEDINGQYFIPTTDTFTRILLDDMPESKYHRRKQELKTVIHWGQRKLLLHEIEFLTQYCKNNTDIVVYAGSAPGKHINYLSELFPNLVFHLYDIKSFSCKPTERILIFNRLFTDDIAKKYSNMNVVFISDIRTASWANMNKVEVEERVSQDMVAQKTWVEIMNPKISSLKFRLPYYYNNNIINELSSSSSLCNCTPSPQPKLPNTSSSNLSNISITDTIKYFEGTLFLPVWGPQTTTETRLITDGKKYRIYDCQSYDSKLFFFNTTTRVQCFNQGELWNDSKTRNNTGLDHCYDCTSEIFILYKYFLWKWKYLHPDLISNTNSNNQKANFKECEDSTMMGKVYKMSDLISKKLTGYHRTLRDPQPKPGYRKL